MDRVRRRLRRRPRVAVRPDATVDGHRPDPTVGGHRLESGERLDIYTDNPSLDIASLETQQQL